MLDTLLGEDGTAHNAAPLAFTSRRLAAAVAAADDVWSHHLDWLDILPPGTTPWRYYCGRMASRCHVRAWLRKLAMFLDPTSAAALRRPGASVPELATAEAALRQRLPWELYEMYRCADGQRPDAGFGVQAIYGARLLSLAELVAGAQAWRQAQRPEVAQREPAPAATGASAGVSSSSDGRGTDLETAGSMGRASVPPSRSSEEGADLGAVNSMDKSAEPPSRFGYGGGADSMAPPWVPLPCQPDSCPGVDSTGIPAEQLLLPFTGELRGCKQYAMDPGGRVWLVSGFNRLLAADSLSALLRRSLT